MKKKIKDASKEEIENFEELSDQLITFIEKYWDVKTKPKGYDEFVKDYEGYDGIDELDVDKISGEFGGFDDSTSCTSSFPIKLTLPHVAYGDKKQGREPFKTLVGIILSYGIAIGYRRNNIDLS